jgi:hypothetical protein
MLACEWVHMNTCMAHMSMRARVHLHAHVHACVYAVPVFRAGGCKSMMLRPLPLQPSPARTGRCAGRRKRPACAGLGDAGSKRIKPGQA